ncbi:MAG TPA: hypothetical protein VES59_02760 [Bacteroidota bacterium]|nr:hypothetical protein [Bacteroidota bacterium]
MKAYSVLSPRNLKEAFILYGLVAFGGMVWGAIYAILKILGIDYWWLYTLIIIGAVLSALYLWQKYKQKSRDALLGAISPLTANTLVTIERISTTNSEWHLLLFPRQLGEEEDWPIVSDIDSPPVDINSSRDYATAKG